jgi:hypothetical protein
VPGFPVRVEGRRPGDGQPAGLGPERARGLTVEPAASHTAPRPQGGHGTLGGLCARGRLPVGVEVSAASLDETEAVRSSKVLVSGWDADPEAFHDLRGCRLIGVE